MREPTEEDFRQTDDHGFIAGYGWKWRDSHDSEWEPACCYQKPWMYPQRTYCGQPERFHRMVVVQGPVLVRRTNGKATDAS